MDRSYSQLEKYSAAIAAEFSRRNRDENGIVEIIIDYIDDRLLCEGNTIRLGRSGRPHHFANSVIPVNDDGIPVELPVESLADERHNEKSIRAGDTFLYLKLAVLSLTSLAIGLLHMLAFSHGYIALELATIDPIPLIVIIFLARSRGSEQVLWAVVPTAAMALIFHMLTCCWAYASMVETELLATVTNIMATIFAYKYYQSDPRNIAAPQLRDNLRIAIASED
jgi:hypothetical protein